ncbi:hypothetical protein D3C71_1559810 [compost metagenome]
MPQLRLATFLLLPPHAGQAPGQLLLATLQQLQACLRTLCVQAQQRAVGALHRLAQPMPLQLHHPRGQASHARLQLAPVGYQQLGGHRRGGRAQVGGEVGQAEVGFVAYRRYHRSGTGGDGPGKLFIVEGPQVFQ